MPEERRPTARALQTLELLQAQPGITAAHFAHRLGVTERAVRRYVAILREAGILGESVPPPWRTGLNRWQSDLISGYMALHRRRCDLMVEGSAFCGGA